MKKLTSNKLRSMLSELDKSELVEMIISMSALPDVNDYLSAAMLGEEAAFEIMEDYKQRITKFLAHLKLRDAKNLISKFKKYYSSPDMTAELTLYYVRACLDKFGVYCPQSVENSMISTFEDLVKQLNESEDEALFESLSLSIAQLIEDSSRNSILQYSFTKLAREIKWRPE